VPVEREPVGVHVPPEAPRLPQVSAEPSRAPQVPPIAPRASGEPVEGRRPGGRYGAIAQRVEERRQAGDPRGEQPKRPSLERQVLGDHLADAWGFR
jgi:hypothetical protein